MKIKTLIHTALVAEAKPIIGHFGLVCHEKQPYNLYVGEDIVLIASGMGSQHTQKALKYALKLYSPQKAINIGIAGCTNQAIPKGTLFCTTHSLFDIPFTSLNSHHEKADKHALITSTLVDMEAQTFLEMIPEGIEKYVFKIVSDHLEPTIPSKADVSAWITKSIKYWSKYV